MSLPLINGKQLGNGSITPAKLAVPYGAEFTYQPGGTAQGSTYTDPFLLQNALFAALAEGAPPVCNVDCSFVSPAPWPVDIFLPGVTYRGAPGAAAAILGLVQASDASGTVHNGKLWFPAALYDIGVTNVSSVLTGDALVSVGQAFFGQRFTMNNAYIERSSDADALGLFMAGRVGFDLIVENCQDPFRTIGAPDSTKNVMYLGVGTGSSPVPPTGLTKAQLVPPSGVGAVPGTTLTVLLTVGGPDFTVNPFTSSAGSIANVRYDDTIPLSQVDQATWAAVWSGTVNTISLARSGGSTWNVVSPAANSTYNAQPNDWVQWPTDVIGSTTIILPATGRVRVSKGATGGVQVESAGGMPILGTTAASTVFSVADYETVNLEETSGNWWRVGHND